jgi:threonine/homoserine/homoserine lactone efflux protein
VRIILGLLEIVVILGTWWMVSFTGAAAPGPLSAAVVMQTNRGGKLRGILPMVGHSIVEAFIVIGIVLSLQFIALNSPLAIAMAAFGGIVIVFFGLLALRDYRVSAEEKKEEDIERTVERGKALQATVQGVIISILSPYFLFWWIGVGAAFGGLEMFASLVVEVGTTALAAILFYFTHISTDFIIGGFLVFGTERVGRIKRAGDINWINVVIGVFQVLLGLLFVFQAVF